MDDGRSAWAVIFDGSPPRRLEVCVNVCLGGSPIFSGANVTKKRVCCVRGLFTPF
jgi:hypothetical protein